MNDADEGDRQQKVFDKHRLPQIRTAAQKHRREKVGDEWISEPDPGVSRILGRKVVAVRKTRDHADVKRQVAVVVEQARAETGAVFDNGAVENFPENHRDHEIKKKVTG